MCKYNRVNMYEYARKWALSRNPKYYNYEYIGGDCTNFVSQCIYAGCGEMNYNRLSGWYYINANNKSPSWTGVEFLYDFLISNQGAGPRGVESSIDRLEIGDIIQLSFDGRSFGHSLVVVGNGDDLESTFVAAHTFDVFGKKVAEYGFERIRCVHLV